MGAYLYLIKVSFRRHMAYRAATIAGLVTNLFFGIMRAYLFQAVVAAGGDFGGYTLEHLLAYTAWGQGLLAMLMIFGWSDLTVAIKSGEVIGDLWRPADFYWVWQSKDLGRALHAFIWRGLPLVVLYAFLFSLPLPASLALWATFVVSMCLAVMLSFAWRFITNAIAFWTLETRGILSILSILSAFLMGFWLPIETFPGWMQSIAKATPFPWMFNAPLQIILGRSPSSQWPSIFIQQLLWLALMLLIARMLLAKGTKRMVVQGG